MSLELKSVSSAEWGSRVFSPPNTRKPASRDTEGSLKNHPSDPVLAILPHYIGAKGRWRREAYFFQSPSASGGAGFWAFCLVNFPITTA